MLFMQLKVTINLMFLSASFFFYLPRNSRLALTQDVTKDCE